MFCRKCGKETPDNVQFCPSCGQPSKEPVQPQNNQPYQPPIQPPVQPQQQPYNVAPNAVVQQVASKIKTEGVLWIVSGALQILSALYLLFMAVMFFVSSNVNYDSYYGTSSYVDEEYVIAGIFFIIFGVITLGISIANIIIGVMRIKKSNKYLLNPVGIVRENQSSGVAIGLLIYAIFCAGILGIIAAALRFSSRSYILSQQYVLLQIENDITMPR